MTDTLKDTLARLRHALHADLVLALVQTAREQAYVRGADPAVPGVVALPFPWDSVSAAASPSGTPAAPALLRTAALAATTQGPFAEAMTFGGDRPAVDARAAGPRTLLVAAWRTARPPQAPPRAVPDDAVGLVTEALHLAAAHWDERLAGPRLRAVLKTVPIGIVLTDEASGTAIVNCAAATLLGVDAGAVDLPTFSAALRALMARCAGPDELAAALAEALVADTLQAGAWRWLVKEPEWLVLDVTTRPVYDAGFHGRLWLFEDVTQEAERLATLEASEQRYRRLAESMQDVVSVHRPDGTAVFVSPSIERLLGYPPEQVVGEDPLRYIVSDDLPVLYDQRRRVLAGHVAGPFMWRCRRADGTVLVVESVLTPHMGPDGRLWQYQTVTRDVTARAEAEAALRERAERLQHAQKLEALGQLAGGVAHDFNNLLTVVQGNVEELLTVIPDGARGRDAVVELHAAMGSAARLAQRLLTFSRQQVVEQRVVAIDEAVRQIEPLVVRAVGDRVRVAVQTDAPGAHVRVDVGQLEQAVLNLVLNARDAMPGGGHLAVRTTWVEREADPRLESAGDAPRWVLVQVRDDGAGMDATTVARAFEPFFTTKPVGRGTGLGLASVYGFARQSQGVAWIESTVGRGTTVTVALPAVPAPAAGAEGTPAATGADADAHGRLVLVAEDHAMLRPLLERALRKAGYDVLLATDGVEALALFRTMLADGRTPDVVLTDVVMPNMGGAGLLRALRALAPQLPVLVMSGYPEGEEAEGGLRPEDLVEPAAFIAKPFVVGELLALLSGLLGPAITPRSAGSA